MTCGKQEDDEDDEDDGERGTNSQLDLLRSLSYTYSLTICQCISSLVFSSLKLPDTRKDSPRGTCTDADTKILLPLIGIGSAHGRMQIGKRVL